MDLALGVFDSSEPCKASGTEATWTAGFGKVPKLKPEDN
jgi:hypothetical protein